MKITLVCPYDWSAVGGVQNHVANLASFLATNHTVRILAPASRPLGNNTADRFVDVVGRPLSVPFNDSVAPVGLSPRVVWSVRRSLNTFSPHIVHVHEPLAPLVSVTAVRHNVAPTVATFHTWSKNDQFYRKAAPIVRTAVEKMGARIAVSPAAAGYVAKALPLRMDQLQIVPNGVDVGTFATAEPLPDIVDPERPLVLFVGRLEKRKGLDVLVKAFLRLRGQGIRFRLGIVGTGPEGDRCRDLVPASLRSDVVFFGHVDDDELPRFHASAQIFCAPAIGGESFGIVLLEAMAAGLPVVASNIPGYRSVVSDRIQGRLVSPNRPRDLADALETLLANEKLRDAMAAEGRRSVAAFDWAVVGAKIESIYQRVHAASATGRY